MASSSSNTQQNGSDDPTAFLKTASFSMNSSSVNADQPVTASGLLSGGFDPSRLHPLADISDQLEFLVLDDDKKSELPGAGTALPSRGWSDDLCYGTGTTYLSGLAIGGLWGLREGSKRPIAAPNMRLRINSVLNSVTRRGTFIGNSAGVLALVYNAINSSIDHARGEHDIFGSMAAGGISGALFKSTAGVRPAMAAATLMTAAAGIWSYIKKAI